MLPAVDSLLTTTDLALALSDLELTSENILKASVTLLPPSRRRHSAFLLDDLLDHSLNRHRLVGSLSDDGTCGTRSGGGRNDTSRSASEQFGLTASDLSLAKGDVPLAGDESLRALGAQKTKNTLAREGVGWVGTGGSLAGKGQHDGEDGEDEGEDEEESGGGDGSMVMMGGPRGAMGRVVLAIAMRRRGLGHPDAYRVRGRQGCGLSGAQGGSNCGCNREDVNGDQELMSQKEIKEDTEEKRRWEVRQMGRI